MATRRTRYNVFIVINVLPVRGQARCPRVVGPKNMRVNFVDYLLADDCFKLASEKILSTWTLQDKIKHTFTCVNKEVCKMRVYTCTVIIIKNAY